MRKLTWYWLVAVATAFVCLLLTAPARSDDFAAHLKALQAKNAAKKPPAKKGAYCACGDQKDCYCTGPHSYGQGCGCLDHMAAKQPKQGDKKPATDGGADWTWETSEGGYWWRYAAAPVAPPVYYRPAPAFRFFGGGNSCGPTG